MNPCRGDFYCGVAGSSPQDRLRDAKGSRFVKHPKCDGCGKPVTEHFTDERVCGGTDGPGFYICGRKRCTATLTEVEESGGLEALGAHYAAQRKANEGRH